MTGDEDNDVPSDVDFEFDHDDTAPRGARHALSPIVGSGDFADDIKLAASELVTNVVQHTDAGGRMHGSLIRSGSRCTTPVPPCPLTTRCPPQLDED